MAVRVPALVRWREGADQQGGDGEAEPVQEVDVANGDVVVFRFGKGVAHAVRNTGTGEGLIVSFRDVEHDPTGADTLRAVLIPPGRHGGGGRNGGS